MRAYLARIAINTDDESTTRRFWEQTFDRTFTDCGPPGFARAPRHTVREGQHPYTRTAKRSCMRTGHRHSSSRPQCPRWTPAHWPRPPSAARSGCWQSSASSPTPTRRARACGLGGARRPPCPHAVRAAPQDPCLPDRALQAHAAGQAPRPALRLVHPDERGWARPICPASAPGTHGTRRSGMSSTARREPGRCAAGRVPD